MTQTLLKGLQYHQGIGTNTIDRSSSADRLIVIFIVQVDDHLLLQMDADLFIPSLLPLMPFLPVLCLGLLSEDERVQPVIAGQG